MSWHRWVDGNGGWTDSAIRRRWRGKPLRLIVDGPLVEASPDATGRPVKIHLECQPPLVESVQATLERLAPVVRRYGLDL